jgi:Meiotically up-regulated gene 113
MELDEFLDFVSANDELGLLKVKAKTSAPTADEHLLTKFNEINEFVTVNGREPESLSMGAGANVPEFMLNQRLNAIRGNAEQCASLVEFDSHGLLPVTPLAEVAEPEAEYKVDVQPEPKEINSLDDILSDDALGLLDDGADSIFTMRHVPKERSSPEHVSRRKKCKDFDQFKPIFDSYHQGLKDNRLKRRKFQSELQIQKGEVFVVDGMLVYIANIGSKQKKNFGNVNARLCCIFDNGTESNMYLRSLAAAMWKDPTSGQIVESKESDIFDENSQVTDDDQAAGYIYILKSLSSNPEISSIQNLFKIGYSTTSVEKRISNADKEPTYLMAPVHHLSSYLCFNMNAQKFESLLHTFFGKACLDIEIADTDGKMCKPREWFIAPLKAIEMAIQLLINGEIVYYRYDLVHEEVIAKEIR